MRNIWILGRMTFHEAVRRRIVLTGLLLGLCFLILYAIGLHFILAQGRVAAAAVQAEPGQRALANIALTEGSNTLLLMGLYAVTFLTIAMAALLAADTLSGEIGSGTIQTLVTKPIRRSDVVLGKWLGFAFWLALYFLVMAGGTVLVVFLEARYVPASLVIGIGLIYFEALLVMTISLACSSMFSGLATGAIVFGMYGLAFIGGWIEQFGAMLQNDTAIKVGIIASLLMPSESLWRRAAFEMQTPLSGVLGMSPFATVSVPSTLMIGYSVLYVLGIGAIAVRSFSKRDL